MTESTREKLARRLAEPIVGGDGKANLPRLISLLIETPVERAIREERK